MNKIAVFLSAALLLFSPVFHIFSIELGTAESAIKNALETVPSSYEFFEESGALFFTQKKNYVFKILENDHSFEQVVIYSSAEKQKALSEDPRPPVREGDKSPFSMNCLLSIADPFRAGQSPETGTEGTEIIKGRRYTRVPLSYNYPDESGSLRRVNAVMILNRTSGVPVFLIIEQLEFPDDMYSVTAEVEFSGEYSSTCRITEFRRFETGQHGVFKYRYNTVCRFTY